MSWKVMVPAGLVLIAGLGGLGWAGITAPAPPSSVIGTPILLTPVATGVPVQRTGPMATGPTGADDPAPDPTSTTAGPDGAGAGSPTSSGTSVPRASVPEPTVTESLETVDPEWIGEVEDNTSEDAPPGYRTPLEHDH